MGGFFSHQGSLHLPLVYVVAAIGAFLGDCALFIMGRYFSGTGFAQKRIETPLFARALGLLERHRTLFILSNRFIYGLRSVGGFAVGMSKVPVWEFVLLNGISAAVWSGIFVSLGYFFGTAFERILGRIFHEHERAFVAVIGIIIMLAVGVVLQKYFRARWRKSA